MESYRSGRTPTSNPRFWTKVPLPVYHRKLGVDRVQAGRIMLTFPNSSLLLTLFLPNSCQKEIHSPHWHLNFGISLKWLFCLLSTTGAYSSASRKGPATSHPWWFSDLWRSSVTIVSLEGCLGPWASSWMRPCCQHTSSLNYWSLRTKAPVLSTMFWLGSTMYWYSGNLRSMWVIIPRGLGYDYGEEISDSPIAAKKLISEMTFRASITKKNWFSLRNSRLNWSCHRVFIFYR